MTANERLRAELAAAKAERSEVYAQLTRMQEESNAALEKYRAVKAELAEVKAALSGRTMSCICGGEAERDKARLNNPEDAQANVVLRIGLRELAQEAPRA